MTNARAWEIVSQFSLEGHVTSIDPLAVGHIHQSYILTVRNDSPGNTVRYLLQLMNEIVFSDIPRLMGNVEHVTRHVRNKFFPHDEGMTWEVPRLVLTTSGERFFRARDGSVWRVFSYIENGESFDRCPNPLYAFSAGRGFGYFLRALSDIDPRLLPETIPRFQDFVFRMEEFDHAVREDRVERVAGVSEEIRCMHQRRAEALQKYELSKAVIRVIHGDPKFNNLLFVCGEPRMRAVVDLDTCMAGSLAFDFGDLVRSVALTVPEDCHDVSAIEYPEATVSAVVTGFFEGLGGALSARESLALPYAPYWVTMMLAARFLTDYLRGDTYFKVGDSEQNLRRTRTQLALAELFRNREEFFTFSLHSLRD